MSLLEQIYAVSPRRETKSEIIDYYRETYRGRGQTGWKQRLVNDLSGITGMKPKNLERRFDPSRIGNVPRTRREREQYEELGDMLPPMPPEGGYYIHGIVWVRYADDPCEGREVDEYITGDQARQLLKMSVDDALQAVVNHYMNDTIDDEGALTVGECQPPDLKVEAIE